MNKKKHKFLYFIVSGVIAALLYFTYVKYTVKPQTPSAMPSPQVSVIEVIPADLDLDFEYSGRSIGSKQVEVKPHVSGILKKRVYVEGAFVKKGDLLFRIDPAPFEAELAKAKALFIKTRNDWQRASRLFDQQALSAKERDDDESAYKQAKAAMEEAQVNLGYTEVRAEFSGVTSNESLSEGTVVTADSTLLTRIAKIDPIYIYFSIPDSEAISQRQQVSSGILVMPHSKKLTAEIYNSDDIAYRQKGVIDFTDNIVDPDTATVTARAVVPNGGNEIMPGQFVRVVVKGLKRKNAITIPDQAVMQGPQGVFVYVVDDQQKVNIVPVKLGALSHDKRIIESGLNAGDKVIVDGMIKVRPGMEVAISGEKSSDTKASLH